MADEERKGSQSSIGYARTIEKAFDDSEYCGSLDLSGHKLAALPDFAGDYELDNLIFVGMIGCHGLRTVAPACVNRCSLIHYPPYRGPV